MANDFEKVVLDLRTGVADFEKYLSGQYRPNLSVTFKIKSSFGGGDVCLIYKSVSQRFEDYKIHVAGDKALTDISNRMLIDILAIPEFFKKAEVAIADETKRFDETLLAATRNVKKAFAF